MEDFVNIQLKKTLRVIGKVLLHLFPLGLIPLDLYVLNMDENLAIALTMIWIVLICVILALVKNKMRKAEKTISRRVRKGLAGYYSVFLMCLSLS